jgi:hypothetical protein
MVLLPWTSWIVHLASLVIMLRKRLYHSPQDVPRVLISVRSSVDSKVMVLPETGSPDRAISNIKIGLIHVSRSLSVNSNKKGPLYMFFVTMASVMEVAKRRL